MATAAQMESAVDKAEADTGYDETPVNLTKYGKWYGMDGNAWCAMAVSKWYYDAGAPQPATTEKGFAYTPSGAQWYKDQGAWASGGTNPKRGWVVFFYSTSAGRIAHVGLVRGPRGSDGLIPTVEGNTDSGGSASGGSVLQKRRNPNASSFYIAGYGQPEKTGPGEEIDMTPEEHDMLYDMYKAMTVYEYPRSTPEVVLEPNSWGQRLYDRVSQGLNVVKAQNIPTAEEIAAAVVAELPEGQPIDLVLLTRAIENVLERITISVEPEARAQQATFDDGERNQGGRDKGR